MDTLALPSILVVGNNRYKVNSRACKLNGVNCVPEGIKVFRLKNKHKAVYNYRVAFKAQEWMSEGRVEILRELDGCAGCGQVLSSALIAQIPTLKKKPVVKPVERPDLEFIMAAPVEKKRSFTRSAYFNFKVNQTILLADYMNNAAELAKMYNSIDSIRNEHNYKISDINIIGYASPEGSYANNARLSELRAQALVVNLRRVYNLDNIRINSSSVAENWEGLREWLLEYKPSYMQRVIDIIDNTSNPDARDAKIRAIDGGKTYNALVREVYPLLRVVKYTVNYVIIPFTVDEGREMIITHPDRMNQYEMYQVALSYGKDSDEFKKIILMIADRFPDDKVALNNAAIVAWENKDYNAMRMYLDKLKKIAL